MDYKFYDTSSLLLRANDLFTKEEDMKLGFGISSITLQELENIKISTYKSPEIKYAARHLLHLLDKYEALYDTIIYQEDFSRMITSKGLELTNDTKILACALFYEAKYHPDEMIFVTNDLALKRIANLFLGEDCITSIQEEVDNYCGYSEVKLNDEELSNFYSNLSNNIGNNYINGYLIVKDLNDEIVDKMRWDGMSYVPITYHNFKSKYFGEVKPVKGDIYQACAADSLSRNTITMLKGPAGSGKSYLALGYLLSQLEKGKIDKIIVFANPVATRGSARLGFYPGTKDEKLLDSQIGNFLTSKIGGRIEVERMIQEEKIVLLPFSDIRGYDTTGMRAGIYITEAQNLDINLMKLALQRIGSDSICIIDGDNKAQVDLDEYSGFNNGMKRVSKVFRGQDIYGEVELKIIHRSKIAEIAEKL